MTRLALLLPLTLLAAAPLVPPGQLKKAVGPVKLKEIITRMGTNPTATAAGKMKVQRVVVKNATSSAQLKRRAAMGIIQTISSQTLTLTHQIKKDQIYTVFLTSQTVVKSKAATGSASLAVGQRVAVVGDLVSGGISAKLIHIIPGLARGLLATPSAAPAGQIKPAWP